MMRLAAENQMKELMAEEEEEGLLPPDERSGGRKSQLAGGGAGVGRQSQWAGAAGVGRQSQGAAGVGRQSQWGAQARVSSIGGQTTRKSAYPTRKSQFSGFRPSSAPGGAGAAGGSSANLGGVTFSLDIHEKNAELLQHMGLPPPRRTVAAAKKMLPSIMKPPGFAIGKGSSSGASSSAVLVASDSEVQEWSSDLDLGVGGDQDPEKTRREREMRKLWGRDTSSSSGSSGGGAFSFGKKRESKCVAATVDKDGQLVYDKDQGEFVVRSFRKFAPKKASGFAKVMLGKGGSSSSNGDPWATPPSSKDPWATPSSTDESASQNVLDKPGIKPSSKQKALAFKPGDRESSSEEEEDEDELISSDELEGAMERQEKDEMAGSQMLEAWGKTEMTDAKKKFDKSSIRKSMALLFDKAGMDGEKEIAKMEGDAKAGLPLLRQWCYYSESGPSQERTLCTIFWEGICRLGVGGWWLVWIVVLGSVWDRS